MSYYVLPRINCNISASNIKIKFGALKRSSMIGRSGKKAGCSEVVKQALFIPKSDDQTN